MSRGADGPQKLDELVIDHVRGFVLYPMAHVVEIKAPHETRKTGTHLGRRNRIKLVQSIRFPPDEK